MLRRGGSRSAARSPIALYPSQGILSSAKEHWILAGTPYPPSVGGLVTYYVKPRSSIMKDWRKGLGSPS